MFLLLPTFLSTAAFIGIYTLKCRSERSWRVFVRRSGSGAGIEEYLQEVGLYSDYTKRQIAALYFEIIALAISWKRPASFCHLIQAGYDISMRRFLHPFLLSANGMQVFML
jgi:hypothetical protein